MSKCNPKKKEKKLGTFLHKSCAYIRRSGVMCKELRASILVVSHFTAKERKIAMSTKVLTLLPISQRQLLL